MTAMPMKKGASGKKAATEEKSVRATTADKESDDSHLRDVYLSRQWTKMLKRGTLHPVHQQAHASFLKAGRGKTSSTPRAVNLLLVVVSSCNTYRNTTHTQVANTSTRATDMEHKNPISHQHIYVNPNGRRYIIETVHHHIITM